MRLATDTHNQARPHGAGCSWRSSASSPGPCGPSRLPVDVAERLARTGARDSRRGRQDPHQGCLHRLGADQRQGAAAVSGARRPVKKDDTVVAIIEPMAPPFLDVRAMRELEAQAAAAKAAVALAEAEVRQAQSELEFAEAELARARRWRDQRPLPNAPWRRRGWMPIRAVPRWREPPPIWRFASARSRAPRRG